MRLGSAPSGDRFFGGLKGLGVKVVLDPPRSDMAAEPPPVRVVTLVTTRMGFPEMEFSGRHDATVLVHDEWAAFSSLLHRVAGEAWAYWSQDWMLRLQAGQPVMTQSEASLCGIVIRNQTQANANDPEPWYGILEEAGILAASTTPWLRDAVHEHRRHYRLDAHQSASSSASRQSRQAVDRRRRDPRQA